MIELMAFYKMSVAETPNSLQEGLKFRLDISAYIENSYIFSTGDVKQHSWSERNALALIHWLSLSPAGNISIILNLTC
jgi:hypothetical protein